MRSEEVRRPADVQSCLSGSPSVHEVASTSSCFLPSVSYFWNLARSTTHLFSQAAPHIICLVCPRYAQCQFLFLNSSDGGSRQPYGLQNSTCKCDHVSQTSGLRVESPSPTDPTLTSNALPSLSPTPLCSQLSGDLKCRLLGGLIPSARPPFTP
jgi:hypothetical protein